VGLGMAAQLARHSLPEESERLRTLRDQLQTHLLDQCSGAVVHGHPVLRLPNTLSISFPGLVGSDLLREASGVAASTGAACHSGTVAPSSVLLSMGVPRELAIGTIRLSLGRFTTADQIERAANELARAVRKLSPSIAKKIALRMPSRRSRRTSSSA